MENIPNEEYRLTLTHEMVYPDGTKVRMEPPVTVKHVAFGNAQLELYKSLLIEDMMERMKQFVIEEEGGTKDENQSH